ncbi:MAG: TlpA family protein disulfide reductase [Betaproteobacteria bacterium AqS2]|uniref:TlpA family protein disulfide reductase n=1 Tax=Candidatus Amphirhobacter heronislandensis TaxID=1732024 RepID=A0A930UDZ0_9GAMM|nr:TlpA family protein disulfide reductase [Betaproteobacteria bacterium AqS2]
MPRAFIGLALLALALIAFVMGLAYYVAGGAEAPAARVQADLRAEVARAGLTPLRAEDGAPVDFAALQGLRLVNFWAAWCPPCVRELPLLDAAAARCGPGSVAGLVLDELAEAQQLEESLGLDFPSYVVGLEGVALAERLGNPTGAMPYTVMLDEQGRVAASKLGPFANEEEVVGFIAANSAISCTPLPA